MQGRGSRSRGDADRQAARLSIHSFIRLVASEDRALPAGSDRAMLCATMMASP